MKAPRIWTAVLFLGVLALSACSPTAPVTPAGESPVPAVPTQAQPPAPSPTPEPSATASQPPTSTPSPEPSPTATPSAQALEIVEWAEYPYANLADPNISDTRVEVLVRNPNAFPVQVDRAGVELRLLNAAGETVYANPNPFLYFWEGSWIRAGETVPLSACACFETDGGARQPWETLELAAPLLPAPQTAYTTDVEVSLGEFFSLAEAHLGGDTPGAEISLVNTSDQVLKSFEVRIIARDAAGAYVGVAAYGSFSDTDSTGNYIRIEPGASGGGIIVSEIDYFEGPLEYEVIAIGILASP